MFSSTNNKLASISVALLIQVIMMGILGRISAVSAWNCGGVRPFRRLATPSSFSRHQQQQHRTLVSSSSTVLQCRGGNDRNGNGNASPSSLAFSSTTRRTLASSSALGASVTDKDNAEASTQQEDEESSDNDEDSKTDADDDDDDDENRCPICFARYTAERPVFDSPKCIHHFHQDCILGWLEFQSHRDCPCCRVELVSEEQIWRVVKRQRRELKRSNSSSSRGYKLNNDNDNDGGPPAIQPGTTEDEDDEEDGVDEGYDFGGISASASADLVAIRVDGGDGVELIRYDDNQPGRGLSSRGIAYTDERESLNLFAASSSNNNNSVVDSPPSGSSSPSSDDDDDDDDSGVIPYGMMEV
mmetsp:Transcript_13065/g.28637  ORF Transcript_13065/g.28637 Transcript_13065/m.28637 type:complete len:357 (+) Transcript_13065:99-1169(+)